MRLLWKILVSFIIIFSVIILSTISRVYSWGFYAHTVINRMAVYTMPPEMIGFYKSNIEYIAEHGQDPDKRKFGVKEEAPRHYIDIEHYGASPFDSVPEKWQNAVNKYTEDTLQAYGIVPWYIPVMLNKLTKAFKDEDAEAILFISANLGHYIGDACTPLHTTQYYDGKIPEQKGIHGFWESRLPELFDKKYNFVTGKAEYISDPLKKAWELVKISHSAIDTIFEIETYMREHFPSDRKYSVEDKGQSAVKVYSKEYSEEFEKRLNGMVERQMRLAVKSVGDFWYTAWVNAGQPDLSKLKKKTITGKHEKETEQTGK